MTEPLTPDQLRFLVQFIHPDKTLPAQLDTSAARVGPLFAPDGKLYRQLVEEFAANARRAAEELLAEPAFAAQIDRLPFAPGDTVVGLGDSITDDYQSWLEILRHVLAMRRPGAGITLVNAGVSGDTTAQMLRRIGDVVALQPAWVICMAGTNDTVSFLDYPDERLLRIEETTYNLARIRRYAAEHTAARWVWMTPVTTNEEQITRHWFLGPMRMVWANAGLAAVADVLRAQPDPVVDLHALFGLPPNPAWLLDDGLHPALEGQKAILRALVERVSAIKN
jgi:lysophospholipase L1-like esterase